MLGWLLNLCYAAVLLAASPWIAWAAWRHGKHREGFGQKLLGSVPRREGDAPCLWLHAVSVGEVNLLRVLIDEIERRGWPCEVVVSTTTRTGYDLARKKYAGHAVFYCPLDFTWAVRRAVRRVRPTALVLAELELWPNLIRAAGDAGATVAVVNGRLSDNSFVGYRRLRPLVKRVLNQLDLIAAQDEATAERFVALGARTVATHATGSLKFDGVETDRTNPRTAELRRLAGFTDGNIVFLAGSTQEPEERYALDAYRSLAEEFPKLRLVLVPRHPERFNTVAALLDESGLPWTRRSTLSNPQSAIRNPQSTILLVDTVGELGAWWGTAHIGFVGGSFGDRGGQNMLEPAAFGVATSFGPNTRNFRDIVARLLAGDGAVQLTEPAKLQAFIRRCLDEPAWASGLTNRSRALVNGQQGAVGRTVDLLESLVPAKGDQASEAA
ncbi:MAG: 3-deoxy-D-manno-octulosonic acid transferase [Planctomycetota bacterium]